MLKQFKIDKDIPLPPVVAKRSRLGRPGAVNGKSKYPLDDMQVGDSFKVPDARATVVSSAVQTARNRVLKLEKARFAIRTVKGGVRVWRVK